MFSVETLGCHMNPESLMLTQPEKSFLENIIANPLRGNERVMVLCFHLQLPHLKRRNVTLLPVSLISRELRQRVFKRYSFSHPLFLIPF